MADREDVFSSGVVFEQLADQVYDWATSRGILPENGATLEGQLRKFLEEAQEVAEALESEDLTETKLEIGDAIVCLLMLCRMLKVDMVDCLMLACNKISKRTGRMENGVFVKDEEN